MDFDIPDLSGVWIWSQTPEADAMRQNSLQVYNASFENFLDPGSFQAAIQSRWDEHCAPTNSRLLPPNPAPKHMNHTAWLVNNAQNKAFFDEPVAPDGPKYGLIYYDPPGEGRQKRRKRDDPTRQDLYRGMDFRRSPRSPVPCPARRGLSPDSIVADPLDDTDLMAGIDSDEDVSAAGKLSMDLFRRRYCPIRYPLNQAAHPTLYSATLQRRFFRKNPKHKNASHVYFPWNRDPDDNILGTGHLKQGEWKAVPPSIPVKDRVESWYRTHREAPLPSEAMEDMGLNRKYPLAEQRTIDPITQHQVIHQRVQQVPLPEGEGEEVVGGEPEDEEGLKTPPLVGQAVTQTNRQTGHSTAQTFSGGVGHGPVPGGSAASAVSHFSWPKSTTPGAGKVMSLRGGSGGDLTSSSSSSLESVPPSKKRKPPPLHLPKSVLDKLGGAAQDFSNYMPDYIYRLIQWAGGAHKGKDRSIHEVFRLTFPTHARPPPVNMVDKTDWCWCCRLQGVHMEPKDLQTHIKFGVCPHLNAHYIGDILDDNEDNFLRHRLGSPPLGKHPFLRKLLRSLTPGARERIKPRIMVLNVSMTLLRRRRKEAIAKGYVDVLEPVYGYLTGQIQNLKADMLMILAQQESTAAVGGYTNPRDEARAQRGADRGTEKWEKSERQLDPDWEPSTDDEGGGSDEYASDGDKGGHSRSMKGSVAPQIAPHDGVERDIDVAAEISDPEEDALLVAEIAAEKIAKAGRRAIPAGYTAETWLAEVEKREVARENARQAAQQSAQEAKDAARKRKAEVAKAREASLNPLIDKFMTDISPPGARISEKQLQKLTNKFVAAVGALVKTKDLGDQEFKKALKEGRKKRGSQDGRVSESSPSGDDAAAGKAAKAERRRKKKEAKAKEKARKKKEKVEKEKERHVDPATIGPMGDETAGTAGTLIKPISYVPPDPPTQVGDGTAGISTGSISYAPPEPVNEDDATGEAGEAGEAGAVGEVGEVGEADESDGSGESGKTGRTDRECCRDSPDTEAICYDSVKCLQTPVKRTYICRRLWHPKCGKGNKAADDDINAAEALPGEKPAIKGWRKDKRLYCPLCGRSVSTLGAERMVRHMDKHKVTERLLSDYFINKDAHPAIIGQIQGHATGFARDEQTFTKPRNAFTDGIINLHRTFKRNPGNQDQTPTPLPSGDEGDDNESGSGEGADEGSDGGGGDEDGNGGGADEGSDGGGGDEGGDEGGGGGGGDEGGGEGGADEDATPGDISGTGGGRGVGFSSGRGGRGGRGGRAGRAGRAGRGGRGGRGGREGRRGRRDQAGSRGGKKGPKKKKVAVSKANFLGVVPYASHSIGGYDPPNSYTLPGPLIHHNRHQTPVSYAIKSTGIFNTIAPRNWLLYPPISPEYVEEVTEDESSTVISDKKPHQLMRDLTIDDTNTLFQIDNEVAQCKGVNYAHHSWDLPRYAFQGRRIMHPLEDQLEFCRLQKGILRIEIEQALHPTKDGNKRRRTQTNLFGRRISAFDELPPKIIDTKSLKGQWACVPDIVHQVGDMARYWGSSGFKVPGAGIVNPVRRLIEIKNQYPAPILAWTQTDGGMDYSWVDPEVLRECEKTCKLPREAKKLVDRWRKEKAKKEGRERMVAK